MNERLLLARLGQTFWLGLACFSAVIACIPEVEVPDCVRQDTCGVGGEGARSAGQAGGGAGGKPPLATAGAGARPPGGGASGDAAAGGDAGAGGAGGDNSVPNPWAGAGSAGDGGAGEGGSSPGSCARCRIHPLELVPPCLNEPYETTLTVTGGNPPYQWKLTPQPMGWSIAVDPQASGRGILKSEKIRADQGSVTIEVTDAESQKVQQRFELEPRTACFFAYTAAGDSGAELHLLDPLARAAEPAKLDNNTGVSDFSFSPNGRFLAYRFGTGAAKRLALVELSTLDQQVLSFSEDEVLKFAWSPDSSLLAVAFKVEAKSYLGAVRLPEPGSEDSPVELEPTPAFVESELAWVGNRFVTYHAEVLPDHDKPGQFRIGPEQNPDRQRTAFYAELQAGGFAEQQFTDGSYDPESLFLQTTETGVYAISALDPFTTFSLLTEAPLSSTHPFIGLISPNGAYTAIAEGSTLTFLTAEGGYLEPPAATNEDGETCPQLLAWASSPERVACVADVPTSGGGTAGEVRFFTLHPGSESLEMTKLTGGPPAYGAQAALETARAFSPSGRRFAFLRVTENTTHVHWADALAEPAVLDGAVGIAHPGVTPSATRLVFSPDERLLGIQRGSELIVQSLTAPTQMARLGSGLPIGSVCSEEFPNAPDRYCGHTERAAPFKWSPDSRALAHRTAGKVIVTSFSASFLQTPIELSAPECDASQCNGQFEFQPALQP